MRIREWRSDVCSSDLKCGQEAGKAMPVDEAPHHRVDSDARAVLTGLPGCNLSMPATMILSAGATPLMIRTRLTRGVPSVTGCTVALFWASTFQTYGPDRESVG